MLAHRADIAVDRHAVVVQNHDERLAARTRIVESLIGEAAGERAVANQRQYGIILMLQRPRPRHAERDGDGVGGMSRDKGVMPALARLGKAREAAVLAQRQKLLAPAGQNFMGVALMPHVEHQPVSRRVEHAVDGHRQLDRAEVRGQMPARFRHVFQQKFTQLRTQKLRLRVVQGLDVPGIMDGFKNQYGFLLYLTRCSTDSTFAVR